MDNQKIDNRYTVKQVYKIEKKYNSLKKLDSNNYVISKGKELLKLYSITGMLYPIMGIGVIADLPIWITLSPLIINAVPVTMGVRLLFFNKRLSNLENELSMINNNMTPEFQQELKLMKEKNNK